MLRQQSQGNHLSIVCLIHSLSGGGAERVMAGLASRLSVRGHHVTLVTLDDASNDRHELDSTVQRVSLNLVANASGVFGKIRQVKRRHQHIAATIRQLEPDVVLSFCDRTNIDVLLSSSTATPPVVVCERSDPAQQSLGWIWERVRKSIYCRAATVVALTETAAMYLRPISNRVVVIPSAIERAEITSDRLTATNAKLIVGVGRLEHEKGFDRLLDAFATSTTADWRLVVYGEGSLRSELITQAEQLGVADRFELPGWTRPIQPSLAAATMFCLPSRYEGFPSALLEAMALGVPVISVDCESGPRQIVQDGVNGLLVDSSADGLSKGIACYIDDPACREKLGQAGQSVADTFNWASMVDQFETVLQAAAESRFVGR
ncbi:glycosyltransferase [Stieleria sp. TO1_6]|uniref:glycosyltransferase n=1 Tax=Stieleria tagensis TaxID=2956795 RepID=UPI00209AF2D8|nr:glycosyltransferase [Stieleria tagensis]MCO8123061.1 glycosyltransferase [Stieleria tagensis]